MTEIILKTVGIIISLHCVVMAPAAFTPAVFLSFLLMPIAGIAAYLGHLKWAVLSLCINSIAICISPLSDLSVLGGSIGLVIGAVILFSTGYIGVFSGIHKLQCIQNT